MKIDPPSLETSTPALCSFALRLTFLFQEPIYCPKLQNYTAVCQSYSTVLTNKISDITTVKTKLRIMSQSIGVGDLSSFYHNGRSMTLFIMQVVL